MKNEPILFLGVILAGFACFLPLEAEVSIGLCFLYAISVWVFYRRSEIDVPAGLFLMFFVLYNTWYLLYLCIYGSQAILPHRSVILDRSVLNEVSLLALFSVSIAGMALTFNLKKGTRQPVNWVGRSGVTVAERGILLLVSLVLYAVVAYALASGGLSKRYFVELSSGFFGLYYYFGLLGVYVYFVVLARLGPRAIWDSYRYLTLFFVISLFLIAISVGERDLVARLILGAIVVSSMHKKRKLASVIFFVFTLLIFVAPLSQLTKTLLTGGVSVSSFSVSESAFLLSEFSSASRNSYMLAYFGVEPEPYRFAIDLARSVVPSSMAQSLGLQSTGSWFHEVFRELNDVGGTSGWGLGLVGAGMIYGGHIGIAGSVLLVVGSLRYLYRKSHRSEYWYAFYLSALLISIYSIRADLANFIGQTFKISLVLAVSLYVANKIVRGNNEKR